jgi:hypothetical protein
VLKIASQLLYDAVFIKEMEGENDLVLANVEPADDSFLEFRLRTFDWERPI